jgi:integrase
MPWEGEIAGDVWIVPSHRMKRHGREVVPHGFRSSFRDWVDEATAFADWLVKAALAHAKGDKVEAAYKRGDALKPPQPTRKRSQAGGSRMVRC